MNITKDAALIAAKTRLTEAKAEQAEIKLQVMRGEYVSLSEINARQADEVNRVRTKLLAIPEKLTPQLAGLSLEHEKVHEILTSAITEALTELSEHYEP